MGALVKGCANQYTTLRMRNALSTIAVLLAIVVGAPVLVVWSVRTTVLESAPWQDALRQARVYDRAYDEFLPEVVGNVQKDDSTFASIPLGTDDLVEIVKESIPPAFVQEQVERALILAFDVVQRRASPEALSFTIPLQDVKRRVPIAVQDKLVEKLEALPDCTDATLREYEKRKALEDVLPPCLPKGTNVRALVEEEVSVAKLAANIPDTFDLGQELRAAQGASGKNGLAILERVQDMTRLAFLVHVILTGFWLALVIGAGAWQLPKIRRALQWLGVSLLLTGACTIAFGFWSKSIPSQFQKPETNSTTLMRILQPALDSVMVHVAYRTQLMGMGVAASGLIIVAVAFTVRRRPVDGSRAAV